MSAGAQLTIGFFREFGGGPAVLILGSNSALAQLRDDLWSLADAPGDEIDVSQLDYVVVRGALALVIKCASSYGEARGIVNTSGGMPPKFLWLLEGEMLREAAEKVGAMVGPLTGSCHQYLGIERVEDAEVIVSKGEYDPSIFGDAT